MIGVWSRRRLAAFLAGAATVAVAVVFFGLWNRLSGQGGGHGWYVPGDLRGTVLAARGYVHGQFGAVYGPQTGLVTLPGILLALGPALWLAGVLHPGFQQTGAVLHGAGAAWLPVTLASTLSGVLLLFVTDALAERLGVRAGRRMVLAGSEAVGAWAVAVWWGHPEDVAAIALLLAALSACLSERWALAGWVFAVAVAFQPVVLLASGVLLSRLPPGQPTRFMARAAIVAGLVLAPVLVADWHGTIHTLTQQPNFPAVDHPTPWSSWGLVAPGIGDDVLAAGPLRLAAVLLAIEGGLWVGRRRELGPVGLVAAVTVCLTVRVLFEPVMVAYYVWPVLAIGMIGAAAARARWRLWAAGALSTFATVFGTVAWDGNVAWWLIEVSATLAVLALGAPDGIWHGARGSATDAAPSAGPEPHPLVNRRAAA